MSNSILLSKRIKFPFTKSFIKKTYIQRKNLHEKTTPTLEKTFKKEQIKRQIELERLKHKSEMEKFEKLEGLTVL